MSMNGRKTLQQHSKLYRLCRERYEQFLQNERYNNHMIVPDRRIFIEEWFSYHRKSTIFPTWKIKTNIKAFLGSFFASNLCIPFTEVRYEIVRLSPHSSKVDNTIVSALVRIL